MTSEYLVIIPARYESSRLPGKPLTPICGIPMIIRTYRQCLLAVAAEKIIVATDHIEIFQLCQSERINVVMTSPTCLTGTDRVAEVAAKTDARTYINIQGDEPLFNPYDLRSLINAAKSAPDEVIGGYSPIDEEDTFRSATIPKVVITPKGKLLYISRSPIPTNKSQEFVSANRQVGAYAFPREALLQFASHSEKTPLEAIEDIEILRFLELGMSVKMIPLSSSSIAVDVPADIEKVERKINILSIQGPG